MDPDRDERVAIVAYALSRHRQARAKMKGHDLNEYRLWARYVVEHLEPCRTRRARLPPAPPHSTSRR